MTQAAAAFARPSLRSRFRGRVSSPVFGTLLIALSILTFATGTTINQRVSADVPIVPIKGEGAWGPYRELVPWQNDLADTSAPIDFGYVETGSQQGREDLIAGNVDFAISGVPFTPDELAKVKGGAAGLIDAPIQATAIGFLLAPPYPDGFVAITLVCDPNDPDVPDPDKCIVRTPYTGPIRVPSVNLAAMVFRVSKPGLQIPQSSWNSPEVLAALGVPDLSTPPLAGPAPVMRSEPSSNNYYLQEWAKIAAPDVWSTLQAQDTRIHWEPISERIPRFASASRDGVDQQSLQLGLGGADPASGTITGFSAGAIAPVPPSARAAVLEAFPKITLKWIDVQNANGDWLEPTPDTITAAVAAGGDTPLYALTNKVPGAYPLAWVNHFYAPATGLSIDKTEALASTIRYLATTGQDAAKPQGDGRISDPLRDKALAAANQLVKSNCVGADREVVESTDAGPSVPKATAALLKTLGTMAHCRVKVAATTTTATTAAPTTQPPDTTPDTTSTYDPGSYTSTDGGSSTTVPVTTAPPATTTAPPTTAATRPKVKVTPVSGILVANRLPAPAPSSGIGGWDRFAAVLLGAGLYLVFRGPLRRAYERATT